MNNEIDPVTEEIQSETNLVKKQMLLQKFGLIEPKLTPEERVAIVEEHMRSLGYTGMQGEVFVGENQ